MRLPAGARCGWYRPQCTPLRASLLAQAWHGLRPAPARQQQARGLPPHQALLAAHGQGCPAQRSDDLAPRTVRRRFVPLFVPVGPFYGAPPYALIEPGRLAWPGRWPARADQDPARPREVRFHPLRQHAMPPLRRPIWPPASEARAREVARLPRSGWRCPLMPLPGARPLMPVPRLAKGGHRPYCYIQNPDAITRRP